MEKNHSLLVSNGRFHRKSICKYLCGSYNDTFKKNLYISHSLQYQSQRLDINYVIKLYSYIDNIVQIITEGELHLDVNEKINYDIAMVKFYIRTYFLIYLIMENCGN